MLGATSDLVSTMGPNGSQPSPAEEEEKLQLSVRPGSLVLVVHHEESPHLPMWASTEHGRAPSIQLQCPPHTHLDTAMTGLFPSGATHRAGTWARRARKEPGPRFRAEIRLSLHLTPNLQRSARRLRRTHRPPAALAPLLFSQAPRFTPQGHSGSRSGL